PDGDNYDGVVTHVKHSYIALKEGVDFDFDGVVILPKKVLKGSRDGKAEECTNRIIRYNGNIKNARSPRWLNNCSSLVDILRQLQKRNIWPAIEILFLLDGKTESDFFIGPITRIENNVFWIHGYDGSGRWNDEYEIGISEIFRIEFDSAYLNHFNSYMKNS
ncbi:hypothetical protein, partial [Streptococcus pseudopneumoniae]|uniref:hypothetical protein n=1 Tax=Streptococcus pseudopneumoniae TaxID=257758 RepID=UPI0014867ED2